MQIDTNDERQERVRGDMTPMIDIIFLLLIFFILSTTFMAPEKGIASLLPTDHGGPAQRIVEERQEVNIRLWPAAVDRSAGVVSLDQAWDDPAVQADDRCYLQIGSGMPLLLDGSDFERPLDDPTLAAAVSNAHGYIIEALRQREVDGSRRQQAEITIHCFSGLPWKYAAVAYDAVRLYEGLQTGQALGADVRAAMDARQVAFAPPRVRNHGRLELGRELFEIINLK